MTTYRECLHEYATLCNAKDIPEQTAITYLLECTQKNRVDLYMNYDEEMSLSLVKEFGEGMQRILNHEPMQHVLGYSWFYGYKFKVNQDVLIPRPETEELVSYILAKCDEMFATQEKIKCVDIGTGSGAIAIAVSKEEPKIEMIATDISGKAIKVAEENAKDNGVTINFLVGDMLEPLIQSNVKVDVLISNPPYIPQEEDLESSVKNYEPHVALFGGEDGLKFYRTIFENCEKIVNDKAFMAFEMGWNQGESLLKEVSKILPHAKAEIIKDMNGKDRMLFVEINK